MKKNIKNVLKNTASKKIEEIKIPKSISFNEKKGAILLIIHAKPNSKQN